MCHTHGVDYVTCYRGEHVIKAQDLAGSAVFLKTLNHGGHELLQLVFHTNYSGLREEGLHGPASKSMVLMVHR